MILHTAKSIAEKIEGKLFGNESIEITGVGNLFDANKNDVVCVFDEKELLKNLPDAGLYIIPEKSDFKKKPVIKVNNPRKAFIALLELFDPYKNEIKNHYISTSAIVSQTAKITKKSIIHHNVSIGDYTIIGENCIFYPGTYIGNNVKIGNNVVLKPGVIIEDYVTIGNDVIIHSGSVIGSDGFGYIHINGEHKKIPQIGSVIIEDNVEIGANVCIDRATVKNTIVKKGTKIDNLVQIAHNCEIGENCIIVSQVGISGSCKLGKGCILAGQVGLADHVNLADGVVALSKSGIAKSVNLENSSVWGIPAREAGEMRRIIAYENRLSDLFKRVKSLENSK